MLRSANASVSKWHDHIREMSETYRELRNYCKLYGRKKEKIDIIRKRLVLEFHWASYYVHVPPLILSSLLLKMSFVRQKFSMTHSIPDLP